MHLFGLVGFCLVPSPAVFFPCLLILLNLLCLGSPFHRLHVHSSHCFWCLPPLGKVGSVACVGFPVTGLVPVFWWVGLYLVFLVGRAVSGGVFWGVCELIMILGSLSANEWGCVPVLLVAWHGASSTGACWLLGGTGS